MGAERLRLEWGWNLEAWPWPRSLVVGAAGRPLPSSRGARSESAAPAPKLTLQPPQPHDEPGPWNQLPFCLLIMAMRGAQENQKRARTAELEQHRHRKKPRPNFPPEFWDRLSKVHLTPRSLRELDRRNTLSRPLLRKPATPAVPSQNLHRLRDTAALISAIFKGYGVLVPVVLSPSLLPPLFHILFTSILLSLFPLLFFLGLGFV